MVHLLVWINNCGGFAVAVVSTHNIIIILVYFAADSWLLFRSLQFDTWDSIYLFYWKYYKVSESVITILLYFYHIQYIIIYNDTRLLQFPSVGETDCLSDSDSENDNEQWQLTSD